jgi:hypothetical protein
MLVLHRLANLALCRYVNGADPNRRRGSYRSLADATAAPLKNWHLVEGEGQQQQHVHCSRVAEVELSRY